MYSSSAVGAKKAIDARAIPATHPPARPAIAPAASDALSTACAPQRQTRPRAISRSSLLHKSHKTLASPSARCRALQFRPWRSITTSKLWRTCSGNKRRDNLTVHNASAEYAIPHLAKLAAQEGMVETRVVGDENRAAQLFEHRRGKIGEQRCIRDHFIADAGERLDVGRYRTLRIDQRTPFFEKLAVSHADDADFGDPMIGGIAARRFQINECEGVSRVHQATARDSKGRAAGRGIRPTPADNGASHPSRTSRSTPIRSPDRPPRAFPRSARR